MQRIFDTYDLEKVQENLLESTDQELISVINVYLFAKEKGLNQVFAVLVEQMLEKVDLNKTEQKYILELVNEIKELVFTNLEEFREYTFLMAQVLFQLQLLNALEIYYKCLKLSSEITICNKFLNNGGEE